ncbi:hypothetical protein Tco_1405608 [Tanacetum coccineum]
MDSMILNGQRNTLAEYMILSGADNRPPMLDKDLYDSWKSIMELYMQNKEHGRMILESVEHGPLIWPTIEENGVIRTKKYAELSATEKIQADCDMKATNIIIQGLPTDIYSLFLNSLPPEWSKFVTDVKLVKDLHTTNFDHLHAYLQQHGLHANEVRLMRERNPDPLALVANHQMTPPHFNTYQSLYNNPQFQQQFSQPYPHPSQCLSVLVFSLGDDPIACLNKAMAFLIVVDSSRVTVQQVQGRQGQSYYGTSYKAIARPRNAAWFKYKAMLAEAQEAGQILDEEQLAFLTDPRILDGQAVQTIIPNNAAFQTKNLDTYDFDCDDVSNAKVVLMANISNYGSDVISEASVQDTNLQAQQDSIILSVIEKMSEQMINHVNNWEKDNKGYQNLFYLKKAQRIKPTLYDGIVISDKHVAMHVIDDEETLILEEVSRSKMSEKEKDPEAIKQTISYKPVDYVKLNQLSKDFGKRFVPQQELLVEQAFWYHMLNPSTESSDASPVKMEAPKELHKVSLVNESLKSLNSTLPSLTKCMFDKDLLNEIMEVQTVFDQMEAAVQQCLVDKQCSDIAKKELFLENDRLLQKIMSQDVLLTVMNSMSLNGESVNVEMQRSESCEKCFNLDVELSKTQNAHNDLLKSYSQLEKHCISLELSIQLNEEIFQKDKPCDNQNALEIPEYFENNDLKAQL